MSEAKKLFKFVNTIDPDSITTWIPTNSIMFVSGSLEIHIVLDVRSRKPYSYENNAYMCIKEKQGKQKTSLLSEHFFHAESDNTWYNSIKSFEWDLESKNITSVEVRPSIETQKLWAIQDT
jgi:arginine utilization protein RocB